MCPIARGVAGKCPVSVRVVGMCPVARGVAGTCPVSVRVVGMCPVARGVAETCPVSVRVVGMCPATRGVAGKCPVLVGSAEEATIVAATEVSPESIVTACLALRFTAVDGVGPLINWLG